MERNVIFLTLTKLNVSQSTVQILGAHFRKNSRDKKSYATFNFFFLEKVIFCLSDFFVAKCTYYFSIVPRVNWTSRVSFATVFSTWKRTFWRDISELYNWHVTYLNSILAYFFPNWFLAQQMVPKFHCCIWCTFAILWFVPCVQRRARSLAQLSWPFPKWHNLYCLMLTTELPGVGKQNMISFIRNEKTTGEHQRRQ